MKTKNLLCIAILCAIFSVQNLKVNASNLTIVKYSDTHAITFVENGITFSIFKNGEFDFYLNSHINNVQVAYSSPNVSISFNAGYNYNPYVQYGQYGAILQIENTTVSYDRYGRISRAGGININYAHGNLYRIGGLYIHYNSFGYYEYHTGSINRYNRRYVYHPNHNWFVRPYTAYRIVRAAPYRHRYQPVRHHYYTDHRYAYKHQNKHDKSYAHKRAVYTKNYRSKSNVQSYDHRRSSSISSYKTSSPKSRRHQSSSSNKRYMSYETPRTNSSSTQRSRLNSNKTTSASDRGSSNSVLKHGNEVSKKRSNRNQGNTLRTTSKRNSAARGHQSQGNNETQKGRVQKYPVKKGESTANRSANKRSRS